MTAINTHGRNIVLADLEQASKYTRDKIDRDYLHYSIFYDVETGEVWGKCIPNGSWMEFKGEVIEVMSSHSYIKPQRIADAIDDELDRYAAMKRLEAEGERIAREEGR